MALKRARKNGGKAQGELLAFANALRDVLGLDPIPGTAPHPHYDASGRFLTEEERDARRGFAHVYAWNDAQNIPATFGARRHGASA